MLGPIIVVEPGDVATAVEAMKLGAIDVLERPLCRRELMQSIRAAVAASGARLERRMASKRVRSRLAQLTRRERETLDWVVRGYSSKEIAELMEISRKTVEVHRTRILSKMQARNLAHLVREVVRWDELNHTAPPYRRCVWVAPPLIDTSRRNVRSA